jgi:hypothetical protein
MTGLVAPQAARRMRTILNPPMPVSSGLRAVVVTATMAILRRGRRRAFGPPGVLLPVRLNVWRSPGR